MKAAPNHPQEHARLDTLRALKILDTAAEESYDELVELAASIAGTQIALISLVDTDRQWFKARHGLDASETPRDISFCGHAILKPDQPLIVNDTLSDERFADNPLVTGDPKIRFYAGIPIQAAAPNFCRLAPCASLMMNPMNSARCSLNRSPNWPAK